MNRILIKKDKVLKSIKFLFAATLVTVFSKSSLLNQLVKFLVGKYSSMNQDLTLSSISFFFYAVATTIFAYSAHYLLADNQE